MLPNSKALIINRLFKRKQKTNHSSQASKDLIHSTQKHYDQIYSSIETTPQLTDTVQFQSISRQSKAYFQQFQHNVSTEYRPIGNVYGRHVKRNLLVQLLQLKRQCSKHSFMKKYKLDDQSMGIKMKKPGEKFEGSAELYQLNKNNSYISFTKLCRDSVSLINRQQSQLRALKSLDIKTMGTRSQSRFKSNKNKQLGYNMQKNQIYQHLDAKGQNPETHNIYKLKNIPISLPKQTSTNLNPSTKSIGYQSKENIPHKQYRNSSKIRQNCQIQQIRTISSTRGYANEKKVGKIQKNRADYAHYYPIRN